MDLQKYLDRIRYRGKRQVNLSVLRDLQKNHLLNIPFENLDIHYHTPIKLDIERIAKKVIENQRGGFCYELNGLFYELLTQLGFKAKRVSAMVFDQNRNVYKHEFDHLAIVVELDGLEYLCDVGFGEFSFHPLALSLGATQEDQRGKFRIDQHEETYFRVSKWVGEAYKPEYIFTKKARELEDFDEMCMYQQTSPHSSFTQKKLISKPNEHGRVTLTGDALKITENDQVILEKAIPDEPTFISYLEEYFNIGKGQINLKKLLSPEQVVQSNLDSYNNRDIDSFMRSFAEEIALFSFPDPQPTASGLEAIRNLYSHLFEMSPNLHSTIVSRITFDNKVIDHESIIGRMGANEIFEIVLIYEVKEEKIFRITAIRKQ